MVDPPILFSIPELFLYPDLPTVIFRFHFLNRNLQLSLSTLSQKYLLLAHSSYWYSSRTSQLSVFQVPELKNHLSYIGTRLKVDELSNKVANYFASCGYSKGDEIALLLDNCPEYVCIWLGLAKIGVVTALINTNLKRDSLGHSINCIDVKAIIFGRNFSETVKDAKPFFNNKDSMEFFCFSEKRASSDEVISFSAKSLSTLLEEASRSRIDLQKHKISFNDKMIYIYTSGTTGLPKAAIIRHKRFLWLGVGSRFILQLTDSEVVYNPLPMYHTTGGLIFVSMILIFGGSMIIRKKFSASNYWKEAAKHKATVKEFNFLEKKSLHYFQ
ncbi:unnamed protein product [Larinioides sclopetarius]|uniref:Long-chain-fatty-acid--CoA ligase n=1 Tax=Larinioides sclopetarius TaxID=280406 RepID=A0AAV2ANG0_9ARAC